MRGILHEGMRRRANSSKRNPVSRVKRDETRENGVETREQDEGTRHVIKQRLTRIVIQRITPNRGC